MKKIVYILLLAVLGSSCGLIDSEVAPDPGFEDVIKQTAYDYILENEDQYEYTSFLKILEKGQIDKTLSAYNPDGNGYTLFLPTNEAVNEFINGSPLFSSLEDLINNTEYARAFCRYHVLKGEVHTNDFPFGTFSESTLSEDFLTVGFVIETDTSYYSINNQAPIILPNIEVSNGFVHVIKSALNPVTFTTYGWLEQNPQYSIFKSAVDLTGRKDIIDINTIGEENYTQPVTLLVEPDSVYNKHGIYSLQDLINAVSPTKDNYTEPTNPLNNFVGYHVLTGGRFLNDFVDVTTNYTTYSEIPLNINGSGLDILINKGKEVFDTLVSQGDTTVVDYIEFMYDKSNIITQSGAIHFINRVLKQQRPSRSAQNFGFRWQEPYLAGLSNEFGNYLIEDHDLLSRIQWNEGVDLTWVQMGDESNAWDNNYLSIDGDFTISFQTDPMVQGKYTVGLRAEAFNSQNAVVEVFVDGKKVGGIIDLTTGGNSANPFATF
ncbi:MAG TPA: fasciclin domain-containing protein, partial [Prolixibacteraceae bacterium]|nr:fasciclin domain-containing protein [Prolixibacteraceae bacterium]